MKYGFMDFNKEFPNDDACLEYIFRQRFPDLTKYYRVKKRKCYANVKGEQIYPLKGTTFEKSRTPLWKWFYAIFLFSTSKHGVSAAELSRQLSVTYKCAWRMGQQIRSLMTQDTCFLTGTVEADETYVGAQRKLGAWKLHKSCVIGAVERGGKVRSKVIRTNGTKDVTDFIEDTVAPGSTLYTDYSPAYNNTEWYTRGRVMHSKNEYVRGDVFTNTIEGFWSHFKRSLKGTHASVSKGYLQRYLDHQVFLWNYREKPFSELLARLSP